jgi:hypothetical protein
VYGSTVAVGSKDDDEVSIYNDTGTYETAVSVTDPKTISMYGLVLAAQTDSTVYIFEKISATWTLTASYSTGTFTNVQIHSNFVVAGNTGSVIVCVVAFFELCSLHQKLS